VNNALALGLKNVNGLIVLGGGWWLYIGLVGVSRPVANIVAGGLLLAIGAFPYVLRHLRARKP
jgi:hypothetical protein